MTKIWYKNSLFNFAIFKKTQETAGGHMVCNLAVIRLTYIREELIIL